MEKNRIHKKKRAKDPKNSFFLVWIYFEEQRRTVCHGHHSILRRSILAAIAVKLEILFCYQNQSELLIIVINIGTMIFFLYFINLTLFFSMLLFICPYCFSLASQGLLTC